MPVVQVDLPASESVTCKDVLRHVAAAVPSWLGSHTEAASEEFLADLEVITAAPQVAFAGNGGSLGLLPRMPPAPMPLMSSPLPLLPGSPMPGVYGMPQPARAAQVGNVLGAMFDRFGAFLSALAGGQSLLVVVDNVGRMNTADLEALRQLLFGRAVDGRFAPARLLMVESSQVTGGMLGSTSAFARHEVQLTPFDKNDAARLIAEFCVRRRAAYPDDLDPTDWAALVEAMCARGEELIADDNPYLGPDELHLWEQVYRRRWSRT